MYFKLCKLNSLWLLPHIQLLTKAANSRDFSKKQQGLNLVLCQFSFNWFCNPYRFLKERKSPTSIIKLIWNKCLPIVTSGAGTDPNPLRCEGFDYISCQLFFKVMFFLLPKLLLGQITSLNYFKMCSVNHICLSNSSG